MKILIISLSFLSAGCASHQLISSDKEAWIERSYGERVLYYCRANEVGNDVFPVCKEAKWTGISHPKTGLFSGD